MAISGTIPFFDISVPAHDPATVVTVTGSEVDGQATGMRSTEGIVAFLRRGVDALSVSGILSGVAQAVTVAELSGVMQFQRELAMRATDIELGVGVSAAQRLVHAQNMLSAASGVTVPAAGEVKFGS